MSNNLSALAGMVLFAWFPETANPHVPGPKYRPVLVVDTDPATNEICLAYGTSQDVGRNRRGEITLQAHEIQGLSKDTKFSLAKRMWVKLNKEYLANNNGSYTLLSRIPANRIRELALRAAEVKLL